MANACDSAGCASGALVFFIRFVVIVAHSSTERTRARKTALGTGRSLGKCDAGRTPDGPARWSGSPVGTFGGWAPDGMRQSAVVHAVTAVATQPATMVTA